MTAWLLGHLGAVLLVLAALAACCFAAARWAWLRDRPVVGSVLPGERR